MATQGQGAYSGIMPSYQTTGIVIGRTNFAEADRIIRILTPDKGKIAVVARGVRKIKSRMAGHLELFGEVNLMCAKGHNLDVITSARLIWYPHAITVDYTVLPMAFMVSLAIDRLVESDQAGYKLYEVLRQTVHALNDGQATPELELWFKLSLLENLGYRPDLSGCLVCGSHSQSESYSFSPSKGGLLCAAHSESDATPMTHAAIKYWRLAFEQPFSVMAAIASGETLAPQTLPLCDGFYEHHLGRAFRPA